jgi:hypothetical protein
MTLLFGFFVMLYADAGRVEDLKDTFSQESKSQSLSSEMTELQTKVGSLEMELKEKDRLLKEAVGLIEKQKSETSVDTKLDRTGLSNQAIAEQARLLFRVPCRFCVHFNSSPSSRLTQILRAPANAVVIDHVTRGGPADLAGLRAGDVLESINGRSPSERYVFESLPIGDLAEVKVRRFGELLTMQVKLDALEPAAEAMLLEAKPEPMIEVAGLQVSPIGIRERITRYIPSEIEGLLVTRSCRRCGGRGYSLEPGDVIVSVNGETIRSPEDLDQRLVGMAAVEVWKRGSRSFELIEMSPG